MKMKRMLLTVLLFSLPAFSFSLNVDTLYTPQYFDLLYSDTTYAVYDNLSDDTVIIDSMRIREIEVPEEYHLSFYIRSNEIGNDADIAEFLFIKENDYEYESLYIFTDHDSVKVAPGDALILRGLCLDYCCMCPTKRAVNLDRGDPLILELLFYSGDEIDTCVIMSRQVAVSVRPTSEKQFVPPADRTGSKEMYNVHGQLLQANQPYSGMRIIRVNGRFEKDLKLQR